MIRGEPFSEHPESWTKEELLHIAGGRASFPYFLEHIFPESFAGSTFLLADGTKQPFSLSRLHYVWAALAQKYPRLCMLAPRLHLKSTVMNYGFSLWQLFRSDSYVDGMVISYKDELADDHVAIMKRLAKVNKYFRFFTDLKSRSEHVVDFECSFGMGDSWEGSVEGFGVMAAKRGKHPKFAICLAPETLVRTRRGFIPINESRVGDEVLTHRRRWRQVLKVHIRDTDEEIVKLCLDNRQTIRITENHRVLTKCGWVRADELVSGDTLLRLKAINEGARARLSESMKERRDQMRPHGSKPGTKRYRGLSFDEWYGDRAEEVRARLSAREGSRFPGERNPNWRGGCSRGGWVHDWKEIRRYARERDGHLCQECGLHASELSGYHRELDVHHIDYDKLNNDMSNLVTLCKECHAKTNFDREAWRVRFSQLRVANGTSVLTVSREHYVGQVYNLEVEEDHTYGGKGIVYHNCDDILPDFSEGFDATVIKKINVIFNTVIQSLPSPDDPLVVIGTPLSYDDTLYKLRTNPEFYWLRCPAEIHPDDRTKVAWPERFSYEVLRRVRRRVLHRAYQVEYMLVPFMAINSFLPREIVESRVVPDLVRFNLDESFSNPDGWPVYGGMDIGKEVHPSHISIAVQAPDGSLIQIYQTFLDHLNYVAQASLVNQLIKHFNITKFYYDATRAELDDRGLSRRAIGKKISKATVGTKTLSKGNLGLLLERRLVEEPGLSLLPDDRQVNQICAVDPTLKSIETSEGHGDAFWSNALMVRAAEDGPAIVELGSVDEIFGRSRFPAGPR